MNVSACIATRGDIDMKPILDSLPSHWETIVWDNSLGVYVNGRCVQAVPLDLGPYGRFEGLRRYATNTLCYVQDDDVIVSDPEEIAWESDSGAAEYGRLVCNMPPEFRTHYSDSAMVGFGAVFHRDAPEKAFQRFFDFHRNMRRTDTVFQRESCRIFTALTPRILVDVPKTDMPYASDPNRLWKDPKHVWYRGEALRLAREVRDA
jgi:hypothetical protein